MIKVSHLHKHYNNLHVLNDVNLHIKKGEIVAIVGASGAGKTTLLQLLGTLDSPDKRKDTSIIINEIDILQLNKHELAAFRNQHIGFIFQFHQLLPEFTALENVCIPAFIKGESKENAIQRGTELLTYLSLEHRIHHKPSELSGGEQQRVAIARALINKPAVVFADEPSGNLDSENAEQLHQLIFQLREKLNQTFVIVTHNKELASLADRKLRMKDGQITR